jgi:thiol:disulfide interchange protein
MRTARALSLLIALFGLVALAPLAPAQLDFGMQKGSVAQPEEEVVVSAAISTSKAAPNDQVVLAVTLDIAPGWHTWPNQPVLPGSLAGFPAVPTEITLKDLPEGIKIGPIQWPETKPEVVSFAGGVEIQFYKGEAIAYVPLLIEDGAALGARTITVEVSYQACDDQVCLMPTTETRTLTLDIVALADRGDLAPSGATFANFNPAVFADSGAWGREQPTSEATTQTPSTPREFFGISLPTADSAGGIVAIVALAALGGLILNLTPCVLPVIPIKVMTISQHGGSPGKSFLLGLWMAIGVVAFWVGIGLLAITATSFADPSRIFGIWWVTLGIGAIIALMGVGIMGAFTINLPQSVYMVNPKADSAWGSFVFGVMTGVLGLPCFGFVAGALLASVATQPASVSLAIFAGIGAGMALPYLVLSANPKWLSKVPRTGPASELVKQVMGFLMLAAAAYFIGAGLIALVSDRPYLAKQLHWWAIALFASVAGLWLIVRTFQITKKPARRVVFGVVGLALGGLATLWALDSTSTAREKYTDNAWIAFEQSALDAALARGDVVVLDFTAEWCLNCKALKAAVLDVEPVKSKVREEGVVTMTVDLTSTSAPGWEKLRALGQTGIPTLAIYGPGIPKDAPIISNAYTSAQVLEWLEQARGEVVAAR